MQHDAEFHQHYCYIGLICHRKKATLEVVLAKEAELIKSRTCIFLRFPLSLPLFFSASPFLSCFAFAFNKNSTLAFSDGCLAWSKGHAVHNLLQKLKMDDVY